jgi:hypothetical protein
MLADDSTSSTLDATAKETGRAEELVPECIEGSEGERSYLRRHDRKRARTTDIRRAYGVNDRVPELMPDGTL